MVRFDYSQITKNLGIYKTKVEAGLLMYAITKANELESYMKLNRPWTDRTSMAKNTLTARASKMDTGVRITLSYGVDYGIYLEKAHEQRFAIIEPTMRIKGPEVLSGAASIISKVKV